MDIVSSENQNEAATIEQSVPAQFATETIKAQNEQVVPTQRDWEILKELQRRRNIDSNIWIVISILQILSIFGIIAGIINLVISVREKKGTKLLSQYPYGISQSYESLGGIIAVAIINVFLGSLICILGVIYYFAALRDYVMKNKETWERFDASRTN